MKGLDVTRMGNKTKQGRSRGRFPEKLGGGREVREERSSSQRIKILRILANEGAKT